MADVDQIAKIKSQTLATIATITADPRPNYKVDGREYQWGDYLKSLMDTVAWCDQQINANSPYEIASRGY